MLISGIYFRLCLLTSIGLLLSVFLRQAVCSISFVHYLARSTVYTLTMTQRTIETHM